MTQTEQQRTFILKCYLRKVTFRFLTTSPLCQLVISADAANATEGKQSKARSRDNLVNYLHASSPRSPSQGICCSQPVPPISKWIMLTPGSNTPNYLTEMPTFVTDGVQLKKLTDLISFYVYTHLEREWQCETIHYGRHTYSVQQSSSATVPGSVLKLPDGNLDWNLWQNTDTP